VVGQIAQDGESASHITCGQTGVISELKASIGSAVQKDDVLCTVKVNGGTVREIKSPVSGVVVGEFVKKGDRVDSISSIYTITDLSKLYGTFDIYEKDISAAKTGRKLLVRSIAYPDKVFEGEIIFVSPRVDEDTHTVKVRGVIQNSENLLKFGMFVNAELLVASEDKYIVVPQEAVHIISGKKNVFIKTADEKFEVRQVEIKDETSEVAAIAEGINEGDVVVVQDGFLLKSELLKSQMGEGCAE
jgi:RND family efflux transporter MFP subunit